MMGTNGKRVQRPVVQEGPLEMEGGSAELGGTLTFHPSPFPSTFGTYHSLTRDKIKRIGDGERPSSWKILSFFFSCVDVKILYFQALPGYLNASYCPHCPLLKANMPGLAALHNLPLDFGIIPIHSHIHIHPAASIPHPFTVQPHQLLQLLKL